MSAEVKQTRIYQLGFDELSKADMIDPKYPAMSVKPVSRWVKLTAKRRDAAIDDLLKILPEGMLTREGDSIIYNGENEEICHLWKGIIDESYAVLNMDNIMYRHGPMSDLLHTISNPLKSQDLFSIEEMQRYWRAGPSCELLRAISCLEKGDRMYVGTVMEAAAAN